MSESFKGVFWQTLKDYAYPLRRKWFWLWIVPPLTAFSMLVAAGVIPEWTFFLMTILLAGVLAWFQHKDGFVPYFLRKE